jgi:hypothetical protein
MNLTVEVIEKVVHKRCLEKFPTDVEVLNTILIDGVLSCPLCREKCNEKQKLLVLGNKEEYQTMPVCLDCGVQGGTIALFRTDRQERCAVCGTNKSINIGIIEA